MRKIHVSDCLSVAEGDVLVEMDATANEADESRLTRGLAQDRLDVARLTALLAGDPDAFAPAEGADEALIATARRQMEEQTAGQARGKPRDIAVIGYSVPAAGRQKNFGAYTKWEMEDRTRRAMDKASRASPSSTMMNSRQIAAGHCVSAPNPLYRQIHGD